MDKKNAEIGPHYTYGVIFKEDPLLLEDISQRVYSKSLLEYMLMYRPSIITKVKVIDFNSKEDGSPISRRQTNYEPSDKQRVIEEYLASKSKRRTPNLSPEDLSWIRQFTMACDGGKTSDRATSVIQETGIETSNTRIRIAAIGHRVSISKGNAKFDEDLSPLKVKSQSIADNECPAYMDVGRTIASKDYDGIKQWWERFEYSLSLSLSNSADIAFFPEFALPPDCLDKEGKERTIATEKLVDIISNKASQDCFVFSGTRHEGLYNRGLVIRKKDAEISEPIWHYKISSARGLGENILTEATNRIPSYKMEVNFSGKPLKFNIFIPICVDIFNPSIFQSFLEFGTRSTNDNKIPLFLIPSFNPSKEFVALLRDLSFISRSIVIYVDGLHGETHMFIGGFALYDFINHLSRQTLIKSMRGRYNYLEALLKQFKRVKSMANVYGEYISEKDIQLRYKTERQKSALKKFMSICENYYTKQKFENILRVVIPKSEAGVSIPEGSDCDVLMYDLDIKFIISLLEFRHDYFGNDEFLVDPLQRNNITISKIAV